MTDENRGRYYPALVIESPTTPKQRARNYALYLRLRDGTPESERSGTRDGVGLHVFHFEVPVESCSYGAGPGEPHYSFRLDKNGECYRRLLSYITDHFPNACDADAEVERLTAEVARLATERDAWAESARTITAEHDKAAREANAMRPVVDAALAVAVARCERLMHCDVHGGTHDVECPISATADELDGAVAAYRVTTAYNAAAKEGA